MGKKLLDWSRLFFLSVALDWLLVFFVSILLLSFYIFFLHMIIKSWLVALIELYTNVVKSKDLVQNVNREMSAENLVEVK